MATERIKLFEADIDVDGIIKKSVELKQAIFDITDAQAVANIKFGKASEDYIKQEALLKKVKNEYRLNQKQLTNLSTSSKEFLTINQKLNTSLQKEVVTIDAAKKNNKELREIRNQINVKTTEGKKALDEINKKLDKNTEFIKENVSGLEQQKIGIGDYKTAITDAYQELNIMNGGIIGFITRAQKAGGVGNLLKKSIKGITTAIGGMIKASLAFLATPIGAVIGAIGLVLGVIIGYLKSTQEGMDEVTAVTRPLSAVFQSLIGVLQKVGKFLFEAFSNPKKTITDIYNFIKNKVMKQFEAFKNILIGIVTLDFSQLKKGFGQLGDNIKETVGQIAELGKEAKAFFEEALEKGKEIDRLTKQIEVSENNLILARGESNRLIKEQNKLAEDVTKTDAERQKAAELAIKTSEEILKQEQSILDLKIQQKEIQNSLNDTSREDIKELNELIAQRNDKETQALELQTTLQNKLNIIRQGAIAKAKATQDAAINKLKIELDLYLEQQGIKAKTLQEEIDIAKRVSKKKIDILKAEFNAGKILLIEYNLEVLKIQNELLLKQNQLTNDLSERELQGYISKHQSKIDADLYFSEESLRIEEERLLGILEKQKEHFSQQLQLGLLNQTDYNTAVKLIDDEFRLAKEDAEKIRNEAQKEKDLIDLENKRIAESELFENDFALRAERLEAKKIQEIQEAEKSGADIQAINDKYAEFNKKLAEDVESFKIQQKQNTLSLAIGLLGKESVLGKILALAQITNTTVEGATKAFTQAAVFASTPLTAALAPNAYIQGGLILTTGAVQAAKIVAPKLEKGGVINIGGNLHSGGGTKFYGEDGTHFEAEKGEKMFVLNRQASAALGPLLSDINQQYGGASLGTTSTYLASGGQILRGAQNTPIKTEGIDYEKLTTMLTEGVKQGAKEGTLQGAFSGIAEREDNLEIEAGANF